MSNGDKFRQQNIGAGDEQVNYLSVEFVEFRSLKPWRRVQCSPGNKWEVRKQSEFRITRCEVFSFQYTPVSFLASARRAHLYIVFAVQ